MLRALLSPVERLCEAGLTKRSTSDVWAWCHRRGRQSDWETKIFSLVGSGENYGWSVEQPDPESGKSRTAWVRVRARQ